MAYAGTGKHLEAQQRSHGAGRRNHLGPRETRPFHDVVEREAGEIGEEQEQTAERGTENSRAQIELSAIGDRRNLGTYPQWTFFVASTGESGETLLPEDRRDGGGASQNIVLRKGTADVVDGEVLFAQFDDPFAESFGLRTARLLPRLDKELSVRVAAEVAAEHAEAPRAVPEALRSFDGGELVDEVGAKRFVLALSGVCRFQEDAGGVR